MSVWFWVAVGLFVASEVVLGWSLVKMILTNADLVKGYQYQERRAVAWEDFANQMSAMVRSKEGLMAALDGIDFALEHPDPIEQRKANRLTADIKRIAVEVQKARALKGQKPPEGDN